MACNGRPRGGGAACVGLAITLLCVVPAFAQTDPDPDADATMRFGPLSLKSTIALSNFGVDTNVFNQGDADRPQSDFTMTFTPETNLWLRLGRTWVSGTIDVDWVYYNRFASERSANSRYRVEGVRTFNRLSLKAGASRTSTRDRPGFEIDARSQRLETIFDAEGSVRMFSKTRYGARAWRQRVVFDREAEFRDVSLAEELNRTTTGNVFLVRQELTPLTTVSLEIGREHDRFMFAPRRDADSTRITGIVSLHPLALISGEARFGYRRFTPLSRDVPPFRGTAGAANLSYAFLGTARIRLQLFRDVQPSFEVSQPYYLETGVVVSAQQQIYGPFDVLARVGRRRLAYRDRVGAAVRLSDRVDRVRTLGIGWGYRLGTDKRIGFNVDHDTRTSDIGSVRFSGLRYGLSVTYET